MACSAFLRRVPARGGIRPVRRCPATLVALCLIALLSATLAWPQEENVRFSTLGHQMICACGCNQILLECNHVGCPLSDGMRHELLAAIQGGEPDQAILASFVARYGPTILAAPTHVGFDEVAWIMPFAVLLLSFAVAIVVIRAWRRRPLAAVVPIPAQPGPFRDQIRQETDEL